MNPQEEMQKREVEMKQKEAQLSEVLKKAPDWAAMMFNMMLQGFKDVKHEIHNIGASIEMTDNQVKQLTEKTVKYVKTVDALTTRCDALEAENKRLNDKIISIESQSRRNNLLLCGVKETDDQTPASLLRDMNKLISLLNLPDGITADEIKIERIHRKGTKRDDGKPRQIIMKFMSYIHRNAVWNSRSQLRKIEGAKELFLAEDFPDEIEKIRRNFYPIVKAAKDSNLKAHINYNKVIVDGVTYTVDTLHQLPPNLRPAKVFTPTEDGFTFFYSSASPLSNLHLAPFEIDNKNYICSEQYLHEQKSQFAKDEETARKIMVAKDPYKIYSLGKSVRNLDVKEWNAKAPHVMKKALLAKFSQNEHLKQFLLETKDSTIVECNPRDKIWSCGLGLRDTTKSDKNNWTGENRLGQLLEDVRTSLQ